MGKTPKHFSAQVYSQNIFFFLSVSQILFLDLQSVVWFGWLFFFFVRVGCFTLNVHHLSVSIINTEMKK